MKVLLAPLLARGGGTGHLRRLLAAAESLGERAVFLTGLDADEPLADCLGRWPRLAAGSPLAGTALVVADRRATGAAAYRALAAAGPVVGIDEGGPARRWMTCLIDTLPFGGRGANRSSLGLLDLPPRLREPSARLERVLVSFGGEDPAGLSGPVLRALLAAGLFEPAQLTVVQGPRFAGESWPKGVAVLVGCERLRDRLHEYDLVFTAFGLTCYEALAAGVPVVLVSPSRLHRALARRARLPEAGLGRLRARPLRRLLSDHGRLQRPVEDVQRERGAAGGTLGETLAAFRAPRPGCPVCGGPRPDGRPDEAAARFSDRTYFRCRRCGLLYMSRFAGADKEYGKSYFFDEYSRQYGRTYLEDFEAIRRTSDGRAKLIETLTGPLAGLRVLDVGCAYGPFLAAAAQRGAHAEGIELAADAAAHVRDQLGLPCWQGRFEDYEGDAGNWEAVSMWYVIEHFARLSRVLRSVNRLLAIGGVFAFSTPNALGISGRARRRSFLENSPSDHYTIWDPRRARRVLARFGLRLARVRVTGHHPERFPLAAGVAAGSAPWRLLRGASAAFGLGDTFEAYAVKLRDLPDYTASGPDAGDVDG